MTQVEFKTRLFELLQTRSLCDVAGAVDASLPCVRRWATREDSGPHPVLFEKIVEWASQVPPRICSHPGHGPLTPDFKKR